MNGVGEKRNRSTRVVAIEGSGKNSYPEEREGERERGDV
jgi:hypothetical protein